MMGYSLLKLWGELDRGLNLSCVRVGSLDIAVTSSMVEGDMEAMRGKALFVHIGDVQRIVGSGTMTTFMSQALPNGNKKLAFVGNGRLRVHKSGLEKINAYSCCVPTIFSRSLRMSRACQISSLCLWSAAKGCLQEQMRRQMGSHGLARFIREAPGKIVEYRECNHPFRYEITTNFLSAGSNFYRVYAGMVTGQRYSSHPAIS